MVEAKKADGTRHLCRKGAGETEGLCPETVLVKESFCPEDTWEMGRVLGVGKTLFAQGFAAGLGIREPVNSPTFTIVQQYEEGRLPLYHFDVYRISDVSEMDEIGYEDCFYGEGVCLVEWSELVPEILPGQVIRVRIEKDLDRGFDYRRILVEGMQEHPGP